MEERLPSDVVKAIFHYLGRHRRFPADIPRIQKAFYTLAQDPDYAQLLNEFVFDTSRAYPRSETVELALDRLQKVNLLSCINPGLDQFEISEALASQQKIERLFSPEEQSRLKVGAEKFIAQVC